MITDYVRQQYDYIVSYMWSLGIPVHDTTQYNHEVLDQDLLLTAFVHKSYAADFTESVSHNERLEFLGDGILGSVINKMLFLEFSDKKESDLTLYKISLVREETLAKAARSINLGEHIFVWHGEIKQWWRDKDSVLSDAFEALLWYLYLDFSVTVVESFIAQYVYVHLQDIDETQRKSYKSLLQESIQQQHKRIPDYVTEPNQTDETWTVQSYKALVFLDGNVLGEGVGVSKKKAQEAAAQSAYESL